MSLRAGPFSLEIEGGFTAYTAPRPSLVLVSSAGTERNAVIGDDAAARSSDIPIVQLNPAGVLATQCRRVWASVPGLPLRSAQACQRYGWRLTAPLCRHAELEVQGRDGRARVGLALLRCASDGPDPERRAPRGQGAVHRRVLAGTLARAVLFDPAALACWFGMWITKAILE